jgi:hypothetical protein
MSSHSSHNDEDMTPVNLGKIVSSKKGLSMISSTSEGDSSKNLSQSLDNLLRQTSHDDKTNDRPSLPFQPEEE